MVPKSLNFEPTDTTPLRDKISRKNHGLRDNCSQRANGEEPTRSKREPGKRPRVALGTDSPNDASNYALILRERNS